MNSLKIIHYALVLNEFRNFTAAALSLGMSQSAFSRAIQRLEEDLGVPLFDRSRLEVRPTPFGKVYLKRAANILGQMEEARRELRLMSGLEEGTLKVGFGPVYAASLAGPAVGKFTMEHPNIEIRLRAGKWVDLLDNLFEDIIEIYVGEISMLANRPSIRTIPLHNQAGKFFCRPDHPLLERSPVKVGDLAAYPFVTVQMPTRLKYFFENKLPMKDQLHTVPAILPPIECDDLNMTMKVVANSHAVGLATGYVIKEELEAGTLRELKVLGNSLTSQGGVVVKDGYTLSPAAQMFISYLRKCDDQFAEMSS